MRKNIPFVTGKHKLIFIMFLCLMFGSIGCTKTVHPTGTLKQIVFPESTSVNVDQNNSIDLLRAFQLTTKARKITFHVYHYENEKWNQISSNDFQWDEDQDDLQIGFGTNTATNQFIMYSYVSKDGNEKSTNQVLLTEIGNQNKIKYENYENSIEVNQEQVFYITCDSQSDLTVKNWKDWKDSNQGTDAYVITLEIK